MCALEGQGIADEIHFLPPLDVSSADTDAATLDKPEGQLVLPLFPLGTYTPETSNELSIFEPRYRAMYNDIILNGARRFVVTTTSPETGGLAEVGVIFYLEDLKEVSEQTGDAVKYVGKHKVLGRVRLHKVLNPAQSRLRDTYMRVLCEPLEDESESVPSTADQEQQLVDAFRRVIDLQADLKEDPRFTDSLKQTLSMAQAEPQDPAEALDKAPAQWGASVMAQGFWTSVNLWKRLMEMRAGNKSQQMQEEMQEALVRHVEENPEIAPLLSTGRVNMEELPSSLQQQLLQIRERFQEEARTADPYGDSFQLLLQADLHSQRLLLFGNMIDAETKRLEAKLSLRSLFSGSAGAD